MGFYERFKSLCEENGITMSNIGREIGMPVSSATVTRWGAGVMPRPATVKAIADYFHVDVAWLIGKQDDSTPPNPFANIDDLLPLSSQEVEIIKVFRHASELGKMRIIAQIMKVWEQDQ